MQLLNNGRQEAGASKAAQGTTALDTALDYGKYNTKPCLIKVGGKTYGEIRADCVYQKHIHSSKHLYRKLNAFAFDVSTLDEADIAGAIWVEIHDDDTGKVFHTTIANIRANGIPLNHVTKQLALPLSQWCKGSVVEPEPRQLPLLEAY
jgi:hypothetical protein